MVMPLVSLGLALIKVNGLAQTGSSVISSMSKLVSTIGSAFGKAFSWAIEKARDAFNFIKDFWNDKVKPIFQPIIDIFSFIWDTAVTIVEGAMKGIIFLWNTWVGIFSHFKDIILDVFDWFLNPDFSFLTTAWNILTGFMTSVWDNTIGGLLERVRNIDLFGGIQSAWDTFSDSVTKNFIFDGLQTAVGWIYDKLTGLKDLIVDILGMIGGTILDAGKWVWNGATGIFSEDGNTVSAIAGGGSITNNFNITIDVGGITDRTDKLALAREIAELIQTETARAYGGSTSVSRY
jgi:hypothetical protein